MKAINCLILLLLMTLKAQTQNVMTSSPYSMFGIGELQKRTLWTECRYGWSCLRNEE